MKLHFVPFCLFLLGCYSDRKIVGVYSSDKIPYSLTLREDSTFSYRYKFEFATEYSEGTWSRLGRNKILMNSYIKSRIIPLQVNENMPDEEKSNNNILSIDAGMPDNEKSFYRCSIYINDTLFSQERCDTLNVSIQKPISNFWFALSADEKIPNRFIDTLYTEKYYTKQSTRKNFRVAFLYNDSLFNYRVFNNEKVKVFKKGLEFQVTRDNKSRYLQKKK